MENICSKCKTEITTPFCPNCGTKFIDPIDKMELEDYLIYIGMEKYINFSKSSFNDDYIFLETIKGNTVFVSYENGFKKEVNGDYFIDIRTTLKWFGEFDNLDRFKKKVCQFDFYKSAFEMLSLVLQSEKILV